MQNFRPTADLLNQSLHFNKPRDSNSLLWGQSLVPFLSVSISPSVKGRAHGYIVFLDPVPTIIPRTESLVSISDT